VAAAPQHRRLALGGEAIRAAARRLGVPADTIVEVGAEVGPYAAAMAPLREQVGRIRIRQAKSKGRRGPEPPTRPFPAGLAWPLYDPAGLTTIFPVI